MSASTMNLANNAVKAAPKNPALFGVAVAAGLFGALTINKPTTMTKRNIPALEQEFGTADGYFPSASKGASLSKLPGNRLHIVGEHYAPVSERRTYPTKRHTQLNKFSTNYSQDNSVRSTL